jgi:hypothetical protein
MAMRAEAFEAFLIKEAAINAELAKAAGITATAR